MKSKIEDNSKKFLLEFFKESKIEDKEGVLTITNVSKDFEDFIGKKAPYIFVFDINKHNKIKDSELIMQGSYFLLAIRDYLSDKGQTSLLKINFTPNIQVITNKLEKYKIKEITLKETQFFYEFSFLSNYQYLNDKKQSMNKILIKDGKEFIIDLKKIKTQRGNSDEIKLSGTSESYASAKSLLEKIVKKDIQHIKIKLSEKLKKELERVEDHYFKQIKEKDEELESCTNKIKMLQSKLRHTSYERDIMILKRMIRESEERLEMLKKRSYHERLKIEEEFHIKDEIEKHALSIKNSLINVTIYYYPIFELTTTLNGKKKILSYDPILEEII